jgi:hypothetical protein
MFDILLALNRADYLIVELEIDKALEVVIAWS